MNGGGTVRGTVKIKYLIPAILLTFGIFYVSSMPSNKFQENGFSTGEMLSNLAHSPAFLSLTLLWLFSIWERGETLVRTWPVILIMSLVAFGTLIEIHQISIPGRTGSMLDVTSNIAGIILGIIVFRSLAGRSYMDREA
jgi:VanZ family protein